MSLPVSAQLMGQLGSVGPLAQFMMGSRWTQRAGQPGISDFVVGNPHEMPGYFRISLTANDDMLQRALPIFAEVRRAAMGG